MILKHGDNNQPEAQGNVTGATGDILEIVTKLEDKGAPHQITDLIKNEVEEYNELTTLELLRPALHYQAGIFARGAGYPRGEKNGEPLVAKSDIDRAVECVEAADVIDRAIRNKYPIMMYNFELKTLVEMTEQLQRTMLLLSAEAYPGRDPDHIHFNHIATAIKSITDNAEVIKIIETSPEELTQVENSVAKHVGELGPWVPGAEVGTELIKELGSLRQEVHENMRIAIERRIKENPLPTDEEIALGAFLEQIEPQVVEAVRILNAKGYSTASSGFYGRGYQTVDGSMGLSDTEIKILKNIGAIVKVHPNGYAYISFLPDRADMESLKERWDLIADVLPDRGVPSYPEYTSATVGFWEEYCDPRDVERVKLQIRLAHNDYLTEAQKIEMEKRIVLLRNGS